MESFFFILFQVVLLFTVDVNSGHHHHHRHHREDSLSQRADPASIPAASSPNLYPYGMYNPYYGPVNPHQVYLNALSQSSAQQVTPIESAKLIKLYQKAQIDKIKDLHRLYLEHLANVYRTYFKPQYSAEEFLKIILFPATDGAQTDFKMTFETVLKDFINYLKSTSKPETKPSETEPSGNKPSEEILPGKNGEVNIKVINESAVETGTSRIGCAAFSSSCHSCVNNWCFYCETTGQCLPYHDFAKNSFSGELCPIMDTFGYGTCSVKSFYVSFMIGLFVTLLLLLILSITVLMIVNKKKRKRAYKTIEQREGELKNIQVDSD